LAIYNSESQTIFPFDSLFVCFGMFLVFGLFVVCVCFGFFCGGLCFFLGFFCFFCFGLGVCSNFCFHNPGSFSYEVMIEPLSSVF